MTGTCAEEVARLFVARAPIFVSLMSLDGRLIEVSPRYEEVFLTLHGIRREEVIGKEVAATWPHAAARTQKVLALLAAGEPRIEIEQIIEQPEGLKQAVRAEASYWRDEAGRPAAVLILHQDIAAEIRARTESEARLRAVVDHLPAQISVMDLESGRTTIMNEKMARGLAGYGGYSPAGTLADLSPEHAARMQTVIAQAESAGGAAEHEALIDSGPCAGQILRLKHVLFDDANGRRKLLLIAEDVTELRRSAADLQRAAEEADAANRAKSEFLANMSHEIRTPLNGVLGVAGALARTELSSAQREMVSLIETSAITLETLLSDILDLARIEAGKMELKQEPFDLAASVNACSALFDAAAQAKGLDLQVTIAPGAHGAYLGDAARLRQILCNLLGNAVKFTQKGQVRLGVEAVRGETTSEVRFVVQDTGIGFDAETKARLFSRFEQADGSITRRFGGSGLGLSISRSLAEAMNGRLEADAEPGQGAVFTLTLELPRCAGLPDLWVEAQDPEPAPDPLVGMRVLLAEDHPTNRRVVELILGAAGVDLTCVENGAEAVEAFRNAAFDLILMDMQMPVMDGLTAIRHIRGLEAETGAQPTPVHVLTANAMPDHITASLAAGADGHLSKPILADALLERVATAAAARPFAAKAVDMSSARYTSA